jgi:hypothetical protein
MALANQRRTDDEGQAKHEQPDLLYHLGKEILVVTPNLSLQ